jgi:hypothetical protein
MAFAVLTIPGVSGDISTEYSFWKGYTFTVDGQRVRPQGFPRSRLALPGESGPPVEAKIKGGLFRAHPVLVVGGTEYPTGPPTPRGLQILALLPILALLLIQGALGFLVAFGGVAINMGVVRGPRSRSVKTALMVATFIGAIAIDVLMAFAISR